MRNSYLLTGIAAVIVLAGAWYAFTKGFEDGSNAARNNMETKLTLSSPVFQHNTSIPSRYTCDENKNLSPALEISGVPETAKSLVLIMDDPDIPEQFKQQRGIDAFDHWTLFNIPADTTLIPEGGSVGTAGANGAGQSAYTGPCPPKEFEPSEHRYSFRLYALDAMLDLGAGAKKGDVISAMDGHIIEQTELIGTYERK